MEKQYSDDRFLARWIAGELTPEELASFKLSKDYPVFKKIKDASSLLETPTFDNQEAYNLLLQKQKHQPKVIKIIPNWAYAAAAVLLIFFSLFYALNTENHYQTTFGEQLAVLLPDESQVQLNSKSNLDFKERNWNEHRTVKLNGETFFDVEKGKTFTVITQAGEVEVLGTEFNVVSRGAYFEVTCFEGKVSVLTQSGKVILKEGEALRLVNNSIEQWSVSKPVPGWLEGESSFQNTPISQVVLALEHQYNINFNKSSIDLNKRFTGSFTHEDINLAFKTVFTPMEISYEKNDQNDILLIESSDKN